MRSRECCERHASEVRRKGCRHERKSKPIATCPTPWTALPLEPAYVIGGLVVGRAADKITFPPVVYVPCSPLSTGDEELSVDLRQTRDGKLALLVYSALDRLVLVLYEVEKLLEEGRAVGAKPLRDYMEVRGYADAANWVYGQALEPGDWQTEQLISLQEVRHIHYLCMSPVWSFEPHPHATPAEQPENYREHEIAHFPGGMKPPSWTEVPSFMSDWIATVDKLRTDRDEPLPESLARVHNGFERIHPFLDGNGRAGRLVLNLILGRLGYPPAIIYKRERDRYLNAMRRANSGDMGPLGELLARSITANLYKFVVPAAAGPARLVPLTALADKELGENALRVAALRGRLRATKADGGGWRSTKKWVEIYKNSRYTRG